MVTRRLLSHPARRSFLDRLAEQQGVTPEHFLEVIMARRRYRQAKKQRERSGGLTLRKRGVSQKFLFAGEGRFHELLKIAGMTQEDFARLSGLADVTIRGWCGYPMHGWAVRFLEATIWNRAMAQFLTERGWDPNKLKPGHLPVYTGGQYPRTTEQGKRLLNAE